MRILIYDGDCGFCKYWVNWIKARAGNKIDYAPYQEVKEDYPEIKEKDFENAVQFVDENRVVYSAAGAIYKALTYSNTHGWLHWLYSYFSPFAWFSEFFYKIVARNRYFFSEITYLLVGESFTPSTYEFARVLFSQCLALVYLFAFSSFWVQAMGLIGSHGVMPASQILADFATNFGWSRFFVLPTLAWISSSDIFINGICIAGIVSAILMFFSQRTFILFSFVCWICYLSIVNVCSDFMSFQWESLILEVGFLSIFLRSRSPILIWLYRWLLFRFMFSSAVCKIMSGDSHWRDLTALNFHFETQPLPTWVGWYFHQLPEIFHKFSVALMFIIEGLVPFLFFLPRRARYFGFFCLLGLQSLIFITGNYGFFNILSASLCLFLLDDEFLLRFKNGLTWKKNFSAAITKGLVGKAKKTLAAVGALLLVLAGSAELMATFRIKPTVFIPLMTVTDRFRIVGGYGLFAAMTAVRNEIIIEGSNDGKVWQEYEFKWKPGDINKRPYFVAPHQPHLDWQAWFAALGGFENQFWLHNLMVRILQGEPAVLNLLGKNPFPDGPPKAVHVLLYQYHFSDLDLHSRTGQWWTRELVGKYSPDMTLK